MTTLAPATPMGQQPFNDLSIGSTNQKAEANNTAEKLSPKAPEGHQPATKTQDPIITKNVSETVVNAKLNAQQTNFYSSSSESKDGLKGTLLNVSV